MARPAYVAIGFRTDTAGYQEDPRGGRWEQPQQPHIAQQGVYTRRADGHVDAGSGGRGGAGAGNGRFVARFEGDYDGGHASARHGHAGSASNERAPDVVVATEEAFGAMAPCWRLLERAKAYMDHVRANAELPLFSLFFCGLRFDFSEVRAAVVSLFLSRLKWF